jgi:hypothetical protein
VDLFDLDPRWSATTRATTAETMPTGRMQTEARSEAGAAPRPTHSNVTRGIRARSSRAISTCRAARRQRPACMPRR